MQRLKYILFGFAIVMCLSASYIYSKYIIEPEIEYLNEEVELNPDGTVKK